MVRIKIELVPFGVGEPREIGRMQVWNDGTGTKSIGNYGFKIFRKNSESIMKSGEIKGYKRQQWSVWYLLYLCLREVYNK